MADFSEKTENTSSVVEFRVLDVKYCPICSLPFEYCENGPSKELCSKWLSEHHPDMMDAATLADTLANTNINEGEAEDDVIIMYYIFISC